MTPFFACPYVIIYLSYRVPSSPPSWFEVYLLCHFVISVINGLSTLPSEDYIIATTTLLMRSSIDQVTCNQAVESQYYSTRT